MAWHSGKPADSDFLSASVQHIRENFAELEPLQPHVSELVDLTVLQPHVAALLDSRIVEMGSNANGEYVRWENGLQVCWRQEIVGEVRDFPNTFNNLDDRPFPAVFAELTGIQATVGVQSDAGSVRGAFYIVCIGEHLDRWSRLGIVRHANASGAGQFVWVNLLAIGRWK